MPANTIKCYESNNRPIGGCIIGKVEKAIAREIFLWTKPLLHQTNNPVPETILKGYAHLILTIKRALSSFKKDQNQKTLSVF